MIWVVPTHFTRSEITHVKGPQTGALSIITPKLIDIDEPHTASFTDIAIRFFVRVTKPFPSIR